MTEQQQVRPPTIRASFLDNELVVDLFAGGGGASCGIEAALGRHVDVAINHDPVAMAVHQENHPNTTHFVSNVWEVDPRIACGRRPVGLLWMSPDCTFHSRARGSKPLERKGGAKRRALASVAVWWARTVRPRVIMLENVKEFADWGPLDAAGKPDKNKAGRSFRNWLGKLKAQGYHVEYRMLRACDYGTPTIRERLFLIARCDGEPIVWPEASHGPERALPWRAAAECIDFTDTGRSIFGRKKPLADATMRRIAAGIQRYVLQGKPFIVPVKSWGGGGNGPRSVDDPMRTITTSKRGEFAVVAPSLVPCADELESGTVCAAYVLRTDMHLSNSRCCYDAGDPLRTITTGGGFAVATPILVRTAHGETNKKDQRARWGRGYQECSEPLGTICASGTDYALCTPVITKFHGGERGHTRGQDLREPLRTQDTANRFGIINPFLVPVTHQGDVRVHSLAEPMRTVTCAARGEFALVTAVTAFVCTYYGQSIGSACGEPLRAVTGAIHHALISPTLVQTGYGERDGQRPRCMDIQKPLGTVVGCGQKHAMVIPVLVPQYGGPNGRPCLPKSVLAPAPTITARDHTAMCCAFLTTFYGTSTCGRPLSNPLPTITSGGEKGGGHAGLVYAFMTQHYSGGGQTKKLSDPMPTVVCKDRIGLVTVMIGSVEYVVTDIQFRMLEPEELKRAQGFKPEYSLRAARTKSKKVALVGNSVAQQVSEALVRANADLPASYAGEQMDLLRAG